MALSYEIENDTGDGLSQVVGDGEKNLLFALISITKDLQALFTAITDLDTAGSHSISIPVQITSFEAGADKSFNEIHEG